MPEYVYMKDRQAEVLNHVVEKVLNGILGEDAAEILYEHLESNYSLQRDQIAENFDVFNRALVQYLGSGAAALEKLIAQSFELAWRDTANFDVVEAHKIAKLA
jgi:hypothetical protein